MSDPVNPDLFKQLVEFGFHPDRVLKVITKCNNDIGRAVELLTDDNLHEAPPSSPSHNASSQTSQNRELVPYVPNKNEVTLEDTDLNKAIADSLLALKNNDTNTQAPRDDDLERAIALSRQTSQVANPGQTPANPMELDESGNIKISDEDKALNNAIERSLREAGTNVDLSATSTNPSDHLRAPGVAAGLKNVGNTCYVNSLLQTYFMIPGLRQAVLSFTPRIDITLPAAHASLPSTSSLSVDDPELADLPPLISVSGDTDGPVTLIYPPSDTRNTGPAPSSATDTLNASDNDLREDANKKIKLDTTVQPPAASTPDPTPATAPVSAPEPAAHAATLKDADAVQFMLELQRLFAEMLLSTLKAVDPSRLARALKDRHGQPLRIGNQEDVSEFNDIFLETLEKGLNLHASLQTQPVHLPTSPFPIHTHTLPLPASSSSSQTSTPTQMELDSDTYPANNVVPSSSSSSSSSSSISSEQGLIHQMFYGKASQFFSWKEADGTPAERRLESVFNHMILHVGSELPTLFDSLDAYVADIVDFRTDKGHDTRAETTLWFERLPPVLMFQQSRAEFSAASKSSTKTDAPLEFQKQIYMDRYFLENRDETTRIRDVVRNWRSELQGVRSSLQSYTSFKGKSHGIDEALASVMEYVGAADDKYARGSSLIGDSPLRDALFRALQDSHVAVSSTMQQLRDKSLDLSSRITSAYDHMQRRPYELFAVWVHQGLAGSGHYWAYLRNPETDAWTKFNDTLVTSVDAETVMRESVGGYQNASAYFLIYVDQRMLSKPHQPLPRSNSDMMDAPPLEEATPVPAPRKYLALGNDDVASQQVPLTLRLEIEQSNDTFTKSIDTYQAKTVEGRVSKFMKDYDEKLVDIEKHAAEAAAGTKDSRVNSLFVFLQIAGMIDLMKAEVLRGMYCVAFEKGLHLDMDSASFNRVKERIAPEVFQEAIKIGFEGQSMTQAREMHLAFQETSYWLNEVLRELLNRRWQLCYELLVKARQRQALLAPSAARTGEIQLCIRILSLGLLDDIALRLQSSENIPENVASLLLSVCTAFLPSEPALLQFVSEQVYSFSEQYSRPSLGQVSNIIRMNPPMPEMLALSNVGVEKILATGLTPPRKIEGSEAERLRDEIPDNLIKVNNAFAPFIALANKLPDAKDATE
eukprot:TRINITY_DN4575_c0_g1_i2.p1 TRINITY_DN4575_c0_g1~~TRINITY_DN4575_c0_g1_i2.p1  ORF type:complete len:1155 (+),score=301.78 TRINITY_DN4575_c0_g1_i2:51-3515(+)